MPSAEEPKVTDGIAGAISIVAWVFTGLSVALVVLMVLDCVKRTLNAKALWLILIVIGHLNIAVEKIAGAVNSDFRIGALVPFSQFAMYQSGNFELILVLPIGAVVYFFLRNRMTEIYQEPEPKAEYDNSPLPKDPLE